ncbi:MAG: hypothetical protein RLZ47_262, partial [Bacteroidota bacterium]
HIDEGLDARGINTIIVYDQDDGFFLFHPAKIRNNAFTLLSQGAGFDFVNHCRIK